MGKSTIEWTDATWNPVTGCTKVSQGCKHCYAERLFPRTYPGRKFSNVQCHPERLDQPLRWRKPRMIFVNSMSDLFHEDVPDEFIHAVIAVMVHAKNHIFQILTKRPERMRKFFSNPDFHRCVSEEVEFIFNKYYQRLKNVHSVYGITDKWMSKNSHNIWLGVSIENQETADERIPLLLQTPATVRWISAEPLLGPVTLKMHDFSDRGHGQGWIGTQGNAAKTPTIDWVVTGGESGPKARPANPEWFRSLRDQCKTAGVPFFFKQWGEYLPLDYPFLEKKFSANPIISKGCGFVRAGKKAAGRSLDGKEYSEYPEVT